MQFYDRREAGQLLAQALEKYQNERAVVYALPRGGVALGAEVSSYLNLPLDLIIPRKVVHPADSEYAVCAVTENGLMVCNEQALAGIDQEWLEVAVKHEMAKAQHRREIYLAQRPAVPVIGKTAIIIDDGVATGLSILAAILDVRLRWPAKVVVAVPVLPRGAASQVCEYVDELVALEIPPVFQGAVSAYYEHFEQIDDAEIMNLLAAA